MYLPMHKHMYDNKMKSKVLGIASVQIGAHDSPNVSHVFNSIKRTQLVKLSTIRVSWKLQVVKEHMAML